MRRDLGCKVSGGLTPLTHVELVGFLTLNFLLFPMLHHLLGHCFTVLVLQWENKGMGHSNQEAVDDIFKKTAVWTPLYYGNIEVSAGAVH